MASASVERVRTVLHDNGLPAEIREMPQSTRTAEEAAAAVGCGVERIVKSLLFRAGDGDRAMMILTSGGNQVDTEYVGKQVGVKPERADAAFVREKTGYAIGGVSPLGLMPGVAMFIDETLLTHETVWAAAGTPNTVFEIDPLQLIKLTGAKVVQVQGGDDAG